MTGILPNNGVPPENTQNGIEDPLLTLGCENLYYGPRCNPRLDPFAMNALISEVINALNVIGQAYDCNRLDNLATAFLTLQADPPAIPSGAPHAILQHRLPSGVNSGAIAGSNVWVPRPLNLETYDPGNIVTLAANQFTVAVNCYIDWWTAFTDCTRYASRIFNVTDGVVTDVGTGGVMWIQDQIGSVLSQGTAFLTAGKTYRLEANVSTTGDCPDCVLGINGGRGVDELYAAVRFWRL